MQFNIRTAIFEGKKWNSRRFWPGGLLVFKILVGFLKRSGNHACNVLLGEKILAYLTKKSIETWGEKGQRLFCHKTKSTWNTTIVEPRTLTHSKKNTLGDHTFDSAGKKNANYKKPKINSCARKKSNYTGGGDKIIFYTFWKILSQKKTLSPRKYIWADTPQLPPPKPVPINAISETRNRKFLWRKWMQDSVGGNCWWRADGPIRIYTYITNTKHEGQGACHGRWETQVCGSGARRRRTRSHLVPNSMVCRKIRVRGVQSTGTLFSTRPSELKTFERENSFSLSWDPPTPPPPPLALPLPGGGVYRP